MPLLAFAPSTANNFSADIFITFIGFFFSTTTFAGTSNAASKEPGLGLVDVPRTFTGTSNAHQGYFLIKIPYSWHGGDKEIRQATKEKKQDRRNKQQQRTTGRDKGQETRKKKDSG